MGGSFFPVITNSPETAVVADNNANTVIPAANQLSQTGSNIKVKGILSGFA